MSVTRMEARLGRTPTPRVAKRQGHLRVIIEANKPLTVRRAFYIALGEDLYPKTDGGYELAVEDSNVLRDHGSVGYEAIIDPTRIVREPELWPSPADVAGHYAEHLRLDPWAEMSCRVAVTVESDGLALALFARMSDSPLKVVAVRGNGSTSAVETLARWLSRALDGAIVLHVGDADGQGIAIERDLRSRLALHAERIGGPEPVVERVWLSREQALAAGLPSRPTKLTQMDRKFGFTDECWEAEAGDPLQIASLVRGRVRQLLDTEVLADVSARERAAREHFAGLADRLRAT